MKKTLQNSLIVLGGLVIPTLTFAGGPDFTGVHYMIQQAHAIVQALIPLMIGVAMIVFFWGIVVYLFSGDKDKGKSVMLSGVIALFVMTSVWGLVGILRTTLLGDNVQNQVIVPAVLPQ